MNKAMKSLLLILVLSVMVLTSLNIALARFRRGGSDTYYDFRSCTDGIVIDIAINPGKYDVNNPPTLDGTLLLDGSTALTTININNLELIALTDPIPGLPDMTYWMGSPIASWTKTLAPGSRVELHLAVPNTTVIPNIYTTVENCSVADSVPTTDSYIESQGVQVKIPGNGVAATSIISVGPGHGPIGDVNVAMFVSSDLVGGPLTKGYNLQASLTSPDGTKVELFNVAASKNVKFGSRCSYIAGDEPLIGDEKADFVLDDDSVFQFNVNDPNVVTPFINTAVKPMQPLSSFLNENAAGNWELELINQSTAQEPLYVICWFLEIEDASQNFLPFILRN